MRIIQQETRLPVRVSAADKDSGAESRHGKLLPDTVRCLIVGPSNCGKTCVLMSLLEDQNGLRFENVYVYSKSLLQPKYRRLERILNQVDGLKYYAFVDNKDVVPPDEAGPNSIFVFDDIACEKQMNMQKYFSMGRHAGVDCFYLCQTYSRIPKQLIRDNANMLVLFKMDERNLRHAYDDHVNTDMTLAEFKVMCASCWNDNEYGFLTIVKDCSLLKGRYRRGFDQFIAIR